MSSLSVENELPLINQELDRKVITGLRDGAMRREDPITWRSLIVELRQLFGSPDPDHTPIDESQWSIAQKVIPTIVGGSPFEELLPEIEYAVGISIDKSELPPLDHLIISGRYKPEPLMYSLYDQSCIQGKRTAAITASGHFADGQSRVIPFSKMLRPVRKVSILSSTQESQGGSFYAIQQVINILQNSELTRLLEEIEIIIPMWGGSRGHRHGNDKRLGYEILEAEYSAESLLREIQAIVQSLSNQGLQNIPKIRIATVDIHNLELPGNVFRQHGVEFLNADPTPEFARTYDDFLKKKKLNDTPLRVVVGDNGAIPRSENFIKEMLKLRGEGSSIEAVYINKTRVVAGEIAGATIEKAVRWTWTGTQYVQATVDVDSLTGQYVAIQFDDMIDSGKTAGKDNKLVKETLKGCKHYTFAATHPVLSPEHWFVDNTIFTIMENVPQLKILFYILAPLLLKKSLKINVLDTIRADLILLGNTLQQPWVFSDKRVQMVDMAPALMRALNKEASD